LLACWHDSNASTVDGRQLEALRRDSAATGRLIADLIRQGVEQCLTGRSEIEREERIERAIGVAGKFSSGRNDVSADHGRQLADFFRTHPASMPSLTGTTQTIPEPGRTWALRVVGEAGIVLPKPPSRFSNGTGKPGCGFCLAEPGKPSDARE
jgi:hypothetical protein